MSRDRKLPSDFWTWEAVIDCSLRARLLFLGLWNFADSHGVQPLRPRTIRLQVFPGDDITDEAVRDVIDELVQRKLLRLYVVHEQEYIEIADWALFQRVGRRAKRRHPRDPSLPPEPVAEPAPAPTPMAVPATPSSPATDEDGTALPEFRRWRRAIARKLQHFLPHTGAPYDTEHWIERWIAEGYDLYADVMPAISAALRPVPGEGPPGLAAVAAYAEANRVRRLAVAIDAQNGPVSFAA